MTRLILALQLMTRLPLPNVRADEDDFVAAIRWFPASGVLVGAAVAGAQWLGVQADAWAGALLALLVWVGFTGALHIDGLGDIADAAGAAHGDRARLSAVLADPHIGSFGVTAIILQLLAKLVLLRLAVDVVSPAALLALCVVARIGPLVWTWWLPPLHEGLGSRFRQGLDRRHLVCWAMAGLALALIDPVLLAGAPLIMLWGWWLRRRIGGISGDGHGAGIELVESGLLATLVFSA